MFKSTLAAVVTLLMFMGSTGFAGGGGRRGGGKCDPEKVPGSYVRNNANPPFMQQLKLDSDGTAYWYDSAAFQLILTTGTFIPHIGSWKCLDDGSLLVTTIGTNYDGIAVDTQINQNERLTEKLTVVDSNTLQPTHRIFTAIPLADDPQGPGVLISACTPTGTPCAPVAYKRVKPNPSDIP